jgi:hypothetical protein
MPQILRIPVNIATANDNILVAGIAQKLIYPHSYVLSPNGNDLILTFKSGGTEGGSNTPLTGPLQVGPIVNIPGLSLSPTLYDGAPFATIPQTYPNADDLVLNIQTVVGGSGVVLLTGWFNYYQL